MKYNLFIFDLDGTLLKSDKSISENTINVLKECKKQGFLIGISTSRSEQNSYSFIAEVCPDIVISSCGALVRYENEYIFKAEFTPSETAYIIKNIRDTCGANCEITVDTTDKHYWNYKINPQEYDKTWGNSIYSDFTNFNKPSLKICVEIFCEKTFEKLKQKLSDCDCIRFSDGYWYKITKKNITKENAILSICESLSISTENIIAFGDDYADIGMMKLCGKGIAMGNAIADVKKVADLIIGTNDSEGIADYLSKTFLNKI